MVTLADFLDPGMSSWEASQIVSSNPVIIIQSGKPRPKGIGGLGFCHTVRPRLLSSAPLLSFIHALIHSTHTVLSTYSVPGRPCAYRNALAPGPTPRSSESSVGARRRCYHVGAKYFDTGDMRLGAREGHVAQPWSNLGSLPGGGQALF